MLNHAQHRLNGGGGWRNCDKTTYGMQTIQYSLQNQKLYFNNCWTFWCMSEPEKKGLYGLNSKRPTDMTLDDDDN